MRILFTGSSSFTGYWFIRALVEKGHDVVATFRKPRSAYEGLRAQRVERVSRLCESIFSCSIQEELFLRVIQNRDSWDLWCHHAAEVADYKNPHFNPIRAVQNNCGDLPFTLQSLKNKGCQRILLTGSVFEQREGFGTEPERAVSPYGLSKGLTADLFHFYADCLRLHLGKFVIPNPFGPLEEPRFTTYLVRCWRDNQEAEIRTPDYVRDNIHVSLLAKAYADFASRMPKERGYSVRRPSGYVETQRAFVERFSREIGSRLGLRPLYKMGRQEDFSEPLVRINSEPLSEGALDWVESEAWDELATYYAQSFPAVTGVRS